MPIPTPNSGESNDDFISRCMSNETMVNEYGDEDQRFAVCQTSWEESKKESTDMKTKAFNFEIKELSDTGEIVGYASVTDIVDLSKDIVKNEAFTRTIAQFAAGKTPAMFFGHDKNEPIGEWTDMELNEIGLKVKGQIWINEGIPKAQQAYRMAKSTGPKGLSVGFVPLKESKGMVEGKRVNIIDDLELLEVSIVPFPANQYASIISAKSKISRMNDLELTKRNVEKVLRDAGFTNTQAKALIAKGYDGLVPRDEEQDCSELVKSINQLTSKIREL